MLKGKSNIPKKGKVNVPYYLNSMTLHRPILVFCRVFLLQNGNPLEIKILNFKRGKLTIFCMRDDFARERRRYVRICLDFQRKRFECGAKRSFMCEIYDKKRKNRSAAVGNGFRQNQAARIGIRSFAVRVVSGFMKRRKKRGTGVFFTVLFPIFLYERLIFSTLRALRVRLFAKLRRSSRLLSLRNGRGGRRARISDINRENT